MSSFFKNVPKRTKEHFILLLAWLALVLFVLFLTDFTIRNNFQILFVLFISLVLWYVMKLVVFGSLYSKYIILCRALAVADDKTDLIKQIEHWENIENFCPTDAGIDPSDVLRTLEEASAVGKDNLKNEEKEIGFIRQL